MKVIVCPVCHNHLKGCDLFKAHYQIHCHEREEKEHRKPLVCCQRLLGSEYDCHHDDFNNLRQFLLHLINKHRSAR